MSYYSKRKKMEKEFDWMEMHCLEAGMSVEAIEEIHRMLLDEVNNDRKYYRHNLSLDAATFSDESS